jgi:N-acetylmuramoyl-L-alanine amidase
LLVNLAAVQAMKRANRGVKSERVTRHKNLAVFESADKMDAALLEIGFITNSKDRTLMLSRDVRVDFARRFWTQVMGVRK